MTVPSPARALASRLCSLHDELRSWRRVAERYPGVPAGTLCRIAKSGGEYLPKDRKALRKLGLLARRERSETEEAIIAMSQMARQGLLWKRKTRKK